MKSEGRSSRGSWRKIGGFSRRRRKRRRARRRRKRVRVRRR